MEYTFLVRFMRDTDEDSEFANAQYPDIPYDERLKRQFISELQQAYDDTGMAGFFEVIEGPHFEGEK